MKQILLTSHSTIMTFDWFGTIFGHMSIFFTFRAKTIWTIFAKMPRDSAFKTIDRFFNFFNFFGISCTSQIRMPLPTTLTAKYNWANGNAMPNHFAILANLFTFAFAIFGQVPRTFAFIAKKVRTISN